MGGLGRGERVYAVRIIGDTGYVVTFRQIDPLYTLDLHDPAQPQLLGELELPGYSSYLHPISDDLLLGIGQKRRPAGQRARRHAGLALRRRPTPKHPTRSPQATARPGLVRGRVRPPRLPLLARDRPRRRARSASRPSRCASPARPASVELGRIVHNQARQSQLPQIDRSLVVGNALLTVSSAGVASNRLTGLANLGWAPFPPPAPAPVPFP